MKLLEYFISLIFEYFVLIIHIKYIKTIKRIIKNYLINLILKKLIFTLYFYNKDK